MSKRSCRWLGSVGLIMCFLIAIGTAYCLNDSAATLQRGYEQLAKNGVDGYDARAEIEIRERCLPLSDKEEAACINEQRQTARQGKAEEYDLEAQRITATWTAYMGFAAIIGMAASLIGVGLVFVTFRETRKATDAARINKEAYIWNERAWIEFVKWPTNWFPKSLQLCDAEPNITLKNSGRSAAKMISSTAYRADSEWKRLPSPEKWKFEDNLVQPGEMTKASGGAFKIGNGEVMNFIVDIEYMILGGVTDCLECRFSMSLLNSKSSIGGFELGYERH